MDDLENRMRRLVRARVARGRRDAVARAAGHGNGTWVTNWLTGVQQHVSIDELAAMLRELQVDLGRALASPTEVDDALDWAVFGLMGQLKSREKKELAVKLVHSLTGGTPDALQSILREAARPHRVNRKARGTP